MFRKTLLPCITLLQFIHSGQTMAADRLTGTPFTTRSEVIAANGIAATSHPLATQVAIDILKRGGSAVDAAIAANAVLGLVEPTGCGIGGDLFAIVWNSKDRQLYGLNASGRAPASLTLTEFEKLGLKKIPPYGALAVSVPWMCRWVERIAPTIRKAAFARCARTRHQLRASWRAHHGSHCLLLGWFG